MLSMAIMFWSYTTFSQGLKPILSQIKSDTVFCFRLSQTKEIAKRIKKGMYCDSISGTLEKILAQEELLLQKKDSIISFLKIKTSNLEQVSTNQQIQIHRLERISKTQMKKLNRSKRKKNILVMGLGVVTLLWIAK